MSDRLLKSPDDVSVTATCQKVTFNQGDTYTLRNTDTTHSIYYLFDPETAVEGDTTSLAGIAAALKALGCSELKAVEEVVIENMTPWLHVVCATGGTATLAIECGDVHAPVELTAVVTPNVAVTSPIGAAADAASVPVTLSTENKAVLTGGTQTTKVTTVLKVMTGVSQFVAVPSTAEALAADTTYATYVELTARKAAGANTGDVYVGVTGLDQGSLEYHPLSAGERWYMTCPAGVHIDLNDIYVDAINADDGVIGWYIPA